MRSKLIAAPLVAVMLASGASATARSPRAKPKVAKKPTAVVAFTDTGINPYHVQFRDRSARAYQHPSTYLPGYPKNAKALPISLNEKTYELAVEKDCELWKSVKDGALYWFPGTKIVGGISFGLSGDFSCKPVQGGFRILDMGGHGTMVASRGAGTEYGACKDCLVVSISNPMAASVGVNSPGDKAIMDSVEWAGKNSTWIDAQSNSWGPIASAWSPTSATGIWTAQGALVKAVEKVSKKHLAFWASGNGAAFRGGVLGHPTLLSPHLTPSAISVGGHDSGQINTWPGFPPHLVADSCDAWAAYHNKIKESADNVSGGTSGATPFVAGGAARILLEARRILGDTDTGVTKGVVARGKKGRVKSGPLADGVFTLAEWKDVTKKTATPRPKGQKEDGPACGATAAPYNSTGINWSDVPDGYPEYIHIGYGAVDVESHKLAMKVIGGKAKLPDRSSTDQYFAADDAARTSLYEVWSQEV
jgi:hypothetical protein